MTEREIDEFVQFTREYGKELKANPEKAKAFFMEVGIVDQEGKLKYPYNL